MRWKSEFSAQVNFQRSGTTDLLDAQKQVTVSAFTAFHNQRGEGDKSTAARLLHRHGRWPLTFGLITSSHAKELATGYCMGYRDVIDCQGEQHIYVYSGRLYIFGRGDG